MNNFKLISKKLCLFYLEQKDLISVTYSFDDQSIRITNTNYWYGMYVPHIWLPFISHMFSCSQAYLGSGFKLHKMVVRNRKRTWLLEITKLKIIYEQYHRSLTYINIYRYRGKSKRFLNRTRTKYNNRQLHPEKITINNNNN